MLELIIGLVVPPKIGALLRLIGYVFKVLDPSKVCAVAVLEESKVFAPVFEESKVCEIVELRFKK